MDSLAFLNRASRKVATVPVFRLSLLADAVHLPRRWTACIALAALVCAQGVPAQSWPALLNDSGQTACYSSNDASPCPREAWPGQDADYGRDRAAEDGVLVKIGAGSAGFDFTKLSNDGRELAASAVPGDGPGDWACTRDNVTGLTWRIASTSGKTWSGARRLAIDANQGDGHCGHVDWRLATAAELVGTIDYGRSRPAIDGDYFPDTEPGFYWTDDGPGARSATPTVVNVSFGYAHALDAQRATASVRLVRGGGDVPRFIDDGNGTITEPRTGLMWDRCSIGQDDAADCAGDAVSQFWQDALLEVSTRNAQNWRGHDDWRLPGVKELASLMDVRERRPMIDSERFPNTDPGIYWSGTSHVGEPLMAWGVFFGEGNVFGTNKNTLGRIRLVRDAVAEPGPTVRDALFDDDFDAADRPRVEPSGNLPLLTITTENGAAIELDTYISAELTIAADDPGQTYSGTMDIRGRGNTTWNMPKQPYRLRLGSAAPLLGLPNNRHWVLLANYADKSLLRNHLAFETGWRLDMAWSPRSVLVDVVLNGDFVGLYQLVEHIRVHPSRVDIVELEPGDIDPVSITGGYLMEIDHRRDCDPLVQFDTARGVPICIDTPDEESIVPLQFAYIRDYMQTAEDVLYGPDFDDPVTGYVAWLDPDSYIRFFLVNELLMNQDAQGFSSIYTYKDRGGRLQRGPPWDFDIAGGNIDYGVNSDPRGHWMRHGPWYDRLFEDVTFRLALREAWEVARPALLDSLDDFLDDETRSMGDSASENFARWDLVDRYTWPNAVLTGSHTGEVEYLKDWLRQRIRWMNANL